jgi:hypothetical protein
MLDREIFHLPHLCSLLIFPTLFTRKSKPVKVQSPSRSFNENVLVSQGCRLTLALCVMSA